MNNKILTKYAEKNNHFMSMSRKRNALSLRLKNIFKVLFMSDVDILKRCLRKTVSVSGQM